jgi:hypothetical protein
LEHEVLRSLMLCKSSVMLSHNVKIEASYGDNMAEMKNISTLIETIMEQVIHDLKQLNATLNDIKSKKSKPFTKKATTNGPPSRATRTSLAI